jgi:alkylation response protein AidB-like acyl-CoA dehydrogenase
VGVPTDAVAALVEAFVAAGPLDQPGAGRTAARLRALTEASRPSLAAGRLCEAHADAQTILSEAGIDPDGLGLLGVWASEGGPGPVELTVDGAVGTLRGAKAFCSGAPLVDHALVTCRRGRERLLALVASGATAVQVCPSEWVTAGMAATQTRRVVFDGTPVVAVVGAPGWYLERPGFWHGAVGVAASWFGGALDVLATLRAGVTPAEPHGLAHLGAASATAYAMGAALDRAAAEIDADPDDVDAAHRRALALRGVVAEGCLDVLAHAGEALGPRALAFDADHAQRVADLAVYVRQHHGRRDDQQLGALEHAHGRLT